MGSDFFRQGQSPRATNIREGVDVPNWLSMKFRRGIPTEGEEAAPAEAPAPSYRPTQMMAGLGDGRATSSYSAPTTQGGTSIQELLEMMSRPQEGPQRSELSDILGGSTAGPSIPRRQAGVSGSRRTGTGNDYSFKATAPFGSG